MQLFENLGFSASTSQLLAIETPLGAITSSLAVDSHLLTFENASHFYSLETDGFAARWELSSGVAEVVISRPSLIREDWEEITDCWAFLWRFKTLQPVKKLIVEGSWMSGYAWSDGGPDSGQNLDAQTWDDGQTTVSLGTEGDDALFVRAEANDWLPQRFVHQSTDEYTLSLVRYLDKGLAIDFGKVFPNELVQAHFVVAWSPYNAESMGTYNAVELYAEHILEGADGRTERQPKIN